MTNDPGAALSLLCLGTGLGLPAQAVHCFAAHPARSGMSFSGNRLMVRAEWSTAPEDGMLSCSKIKARAQ
jgi:hypothetical protein